MTIDRSKIIPNQMAQIQFLSDVKLKGGKKNPHQGKLKKLTTAFVTFTGKNTYRDRVSTRVFQEGKGMDYQAKERPWGVRRGDTPFIDHKDTEYAEFIVEKVSSTHYLLAGERVDPSTVEGYEPRPEMKAESQGGIDDKITLRCVKTDNILDLNAVAEQTMKVYKVRTTLSFVRDVQVNASQDRPDQKALTMNNSLLGADTWFGELEAKYGDTLNVSQTIEENVA